MDDITTLYNYIQSNYSNFQQITTKGNSVNVVFHNDFMMTICIDKFYNIFFNDLFYYAIDFQDIQDTMEDIFTNQYVFCQTKKHSLFGKAKPSIEVFYWKDYQKDNKFLHAWSIEETLK